MKVRYNSVAMARFLDKLLRVLRERRGTDMLFMCRHLLSERGEASQTALAQEIINAYRAMNDKQRLEFYEMLSRDFAPDQSSILSAAADYQSSPGPQALARLSAAVESPRQELFRRINTAPRGTETLVAMREHVLASSNGDFAAHRCRLAALIQVLVQSRFSASRTYQLAHLGSDPGKTDRLRIRT